MLKSATYPYNTVKGKDFLVENFGYRFQLVRFCKPHLSIMSICNAHINCRCLDLFIDIELLKADCKSEPAGLTKSGNEWGNLKKFDNFACAVL